MEGISILLRQFNVSTFHGGHESWESAGSLLFRRETCGNREPYKYIQTNIYMLKPQISSVLESWHSFKEIYFIHKIPCKLVFL